MVDTYFSTLIIRHIGLFSIKQKSTPQVFVAPQVAITTPTIAPVVAKVWRYNQKLIRLP